MKTATKQESVILGNIVINTGSLLIIDPCYIEGKERNPMLDVCIPMPNGVHSVIGIRMDGRIGMIGIGTKSGSVKEVGAFGVDSGQVLLCDVADVPKFGEAPDGEDTFDYHQPLVDAKGNHYRFPKDISGYDKLLKVATGIGFVTATVNKLIEDGHLVKVPRPKPSGRFSYHGCCECTLHDEFAHEDSCGQLHEGDVTAVCSETGYGDGRYPVFSNGKGFVLIDFMDDENPTVKFMRTIMK